MSDVGGPTGAAIRSVLCSTPGTREEWRWLTGGAPELERQVQAAMPAHCVAAAVLVPLIERDGAFSVLLTQRAAELKDHAGQISFPGGRIEATDADPWHAALRETEEEIGLARGWIEFGGYLPLHPILTGYRVTPVVGFVRPGYRLALDAAEVHDAFEAPLAYLFDSANHRPRQRTLGGVALRTVEIPFEGRTIWGATCGMLLTLRTLLQERAARAP